MRGAGSWSRLGGGGGGRKGEDQQNKKNPFIHCFSEIAFVRCLETFARFQYCLVK